MRKGDLNKLRIFVFLVAIIFLALNSNGANIGVRGGISIYPNPQMGSKIYIEFPFSINRADLTFLPEDSLSGTALLSGIFAEIMIFDSSGNRIDSSSTYFLTRVKDIQAAHDREFKLFNKIPILVSPGKYSAQLRVIDAVSKNEGLFFYDFIHIDPIIYDHLNISSLELAHNISVISNTGDSLKNRMVKNGKYITPNPLGVYTEEDSAVYIYAEIYNLTYNDSSENKIGLQYLITDITDSVYVDYGIIEKAAPGSSMVVSDRLKLDDISAGKYYLKLIAHDHSTDNYDTSTAGLIVFPVGDEKGEFVDFVSSSAEGFYDITDLETKIKIAKYLLPANQYKMMESLSDQGKERLINQYFADNDSIPETKTNEFLYDVIKRYHYANEYFATLPGIEDGWATDRGRILIKYGFWDHYDDAFASEQSFPAIKWTYYNLFNMRTYCIFEDIHGDGDYKLVHSTIPGEKFSQGWEDQLKQLQSPFDGIGK